MSASSSSRYPRRSGAGRRRFLVAGVGGGFSVAFLAACSGSNNNSTPTTAATRQPAAQPSTAAGAATAAPAAPAAVASPAAAAPKRGGTYRVSNASPPASLDPYVANGSGSQVPLGFATSRLFMLETGPGTPPIGIKTNPDIAKSVDISSDGLAYTVHLRNNVKFHPPVSRLLTADDVLFSFQRFTGTLPGSAGAVEKGRLDVVQSLDKVDDLTVRFTLKSPASTFLSRLEPMHSLVIMPKEAGTGYDPTKQIVGTGPWIVDKIDPSLVTYRRNPDWHLGPDRPYIDQVQEYVVPEYATVLTQFLSGNLDYMGAISTSDVPRVQQGVKGVQFKVIPGGSSTPLTVISFSTKDPKAPWTDPRVRHALSMGVDRDALTEAAYSVKGLSAAGINVSTGWNNFVPIAFKDYWLDPQGKDIDPKVAQYFKFDPQGAKQLLSAAGFANGFSAPFHFLSPPPPDYKTIAELYVQSLSKIGVNLTLTADDYNSVYAPKTRFGDFDGLAFILVGGQIHPVDYTAQLFLKGNERNTGRIDDAALDSQWRSILANGDPAAVRKQVLDMQSQLAESMYYIPMQAGVGPKIDAFQPYMRNVVEYDNYEPADEEWGGRTVPNYWIDKG